MGRSQVLPAVAGGRPFRPLLLTVPPTTGRPRMSRRGSEADRLGADRSAGSPVRRVRRRSAGVGPGFLHHHSVGRADDPRLGCGAFGRAAVLDRRHRRAIPVRRPGERGPGSGRGRGAPGARTGIAPSTVGGWGGLRWRMWSWWRAATRRAGCRTGRSRRAFTRAACAPRPTRASTRHL